MNPARSARDRLGSIRSLTGTPPALDTAALPADPVELFLTWLDEAVTSGVPEPRAMTLSTVDGDGLPDSRVLILKDVSEEGWAFASTASSRKGTQLADSPVAALGFWWQPMMRAVRVRGEVVEAPREEAEDDLAARSPDARAAVAAGDWRLWHLRPTRVEHWQGSPDRRHTRVVDVRDGGRWVREVTVGSQ